MKRNTDSGAFHCTSGEVSSIHCPSLVSRDYVKQFLFRLFPVILAYLCDLVFSYSLVLAFIIIFFLLSSHFWLVSHFNFIWSLFCWAFKKVQLFVCVGNFFHFVEFCVFYYLRLDATQLCLYFFNLSIRH